GHGAEQRAGRRGPGQAAGQQRGLPGSSGRGRADRGHPGAAARARQRAVHGQCRADQAEVRAMKDAIAQSPAIPRAHRLVLTEALRAPSAHNPQPWRLAVPPGSRYELHYNHLDYLPYDPDDRDAYLAIGAFLETAALAAQRHGLRMSVTDRFERRGSDLLVGSVAF